MGVKIKFRREVTRPKPGLKSPIVKWHGCHVLTANLLQQFKITPSVIFCQLQILTKLYELTMLGFAIPTKNTVDVWKRFFTSYLKNEAIH